MDSPSKDARRNRGLPLGSYLAQPTLDTQTSSQPSISDANCSTPGNGLRRPGAEGKPESVATTLEEDGQSTVDMKTLYHNVRMTNSATHPVQTPPHWSTTPIPDERESLSPQPRLRERSSEAIVDHQLHFVTKISNIKKQRDQLQHLRIQARDDRNQMKLTRDRLLRALRSFVRVSRDNPLNSYSSDEVTTILPEIEGALGELETQDIALDLVEGDLIHSEWKLKESERQLYEDLLGPLARDDIDLDEELHWTPEKPVSNMDVRHDDKLVLYQSEPVTPERLLILTEQERELRELLLNEDEEHAAIQKEMEMRAQIGLPADGFAQGIVKAFPKRREELLRTLADYATKISTTEEVLSVSADHASIELDVLFDLGQFPPSRELHPILGMDQFHGMATDSDNLLAPEGNGYHSLHLLPLEDATVRKDDIESFLSQQILGNLAQPSSPDQQPTAPIIQYQSIANIVTYEAMESLSIFVSTWMLGIIQSSWWSFIRFAFLGGLDQLPRRAVEENMVTTWFQVKVCSTPQIGRSEDPKSSNSTVVLECAVLTPASDDVDTQESVPQISRFKRRHSSGYPAPESKKPRQSRSSNSLP